MYANIQFFVHLHSCDLNIIYYKKIQFKVDINFDSAASKIVFIADLHPQHKPVQWWSINTYSPIDTQTWKMCLFHKYALQLLCSSCYSPNQTELFRSVVCKYNQCSQLSYRLLWRICLQGEVNRFVFLNIYCMKLYHRYLISPCYKILIALEKMLYILCSGNTNKNVALGIILSSHSGWLHVYLRLIDIGLIVRKWSQTKKGTAS